MGLVLHAQNSFTLFSVPAGKEKMTKKPQFHLRSGVLPVFSTWQYLDIEYGTMGSRMIEEHLGQILSEPLMPQQHMKILRTHLLPRVYNKFVLVHVTAGRLQPLDQQVASLAALIIRSLIVIHVGRF